MTDDQLFDVTRTVPTTCEHCGAVREPGQDLAPQCLNDQDKAAGDYRPRPKKCLNAWHPIHDNHIPY
jgi:hypothetical protein